MLHYNGIQNITLIKKHNINSICGSKMPPRRYTKRKNTTTVAPPPLLPPSPQMDLTTFQAAISAAVTAALAHISNNSANGGESKNETGSSNHGVNQRPQRVCSYNDFTNGKPSPFNGSGVS